MGLGVYASNVYLGFVCISSTLVRFRLLQGAAVAMKQL